MSSTLNRIINYAYEWCLINIILCIFYALRPFNCWTIKLNGRYLLRIHSFNLCPPEKMSTNREVRTFGNRFSLFLANVSLLYMFAALKFFGLINFHVGFDLNFKKNTASFVYSILAGCTAIFMYAFSVFKLIRDPRIEFFFSGAGRVTATMSYICSFILITVFYVMVTLNQDRILSYLDRLKDAYNSFTLFYNGSYGLDGLKVWNEDKYQELTMVHWQLFVKVLIINSMVLGSLLVMSYRTHKILDVNFYYLGFFFLYPYIIQSLASSFFFLGCRKVYFLYFKINCKLESIGKEVERIYKVERTQFEKMTQFCAISDQVDELSRCINVLNLMFRDLYSIYKVQLLCVLLYSVVNTLHETYFLYLVISYHIRGISPYDVQTSVATVCYICLNVLEILFIVNTLEKSMLEYRRLAKNAHKILFLQDGLDTRLKQSVRLQKVYIDR